MSIPYFRGSQLSGHRPIPEVVGIYWISGILALLACHHQVLSCYAVMYIGSDSHRSSTAYLAAQHLQQYPSHIHPKKSCVRVEQRAPTTGCTPEYVNTAGSKPRRV